MMESAGVHTVSFKMKDEKILVGSDIEEALEFALQIVPAG